MGNVKSNVKSYLGMGKKDTDPSQNEIDTVPKKRPRSAPILIPLPHAIDHWANQVCNLFYFVFPFFFFLFACFVWFSVIFTDKLRKFATKHKHTKTNKNKENKNKIT